MRSTRARLTAVAALALALSACGGGDGGEEASSPSEETSAAETSAMEEETMDETSEEPMEETSEEPMETTEEETTEDSGSEEAGSAVDTLPAGVMDSPPETVGDFTLADDSGPAVIYEMESGEYVSVDSQPLSSPYEDLVSEIETDNTEAGAGSCGLNPGGTSAVCYQRTEDGVITMNGDAGTLDLMVTFADEFAAAVSS
ncbi:hypothetical protein SGUI_0373 [Serinicoccus hydrothermalis]|uniref:Uncharacterized protein n=1 Tax=Serinicoccus hydrothermalis TaxID=1758689 RepID=A0A1B1N8L4_9MICO|nr:hypothetical protein [Serinicoccus hydrothermalis]ANS77769.1 hypothetical protein SGUI_0373 [Serinicoccus hydrothermalis]